MRPGLGSKQLVPREGATGVACKEEVGTSTILNTLLVYCSYGPRYLELVLFPFPHAQRVRTYACTHERSISDRIRTSVGPVYILFSSSCLFIVTGPRHASHAITGRRCRNRPVSAADGRAASAPTKRAGATWNCDCVVWQGSVRLWAVPDAYPVLNELCSRRRPRPAGLE